MRLLWALVAVALLVGVGVEVAYVSAPPEAGGAASRRASGAANATGILPDFALPSGGSAYSHIADMPLFSPTRKPAPTQVIVVAPEPAKPAIRRGLYELLGVADWGGVRVAQVREAATRRTSSVREGDTLQEMQVTRVDRDRAVLTFQGETDEIRMPTFTATGRVPQPTAPASVLASVLASVPATAPPPVVPAGATPAPATMPASPPPSVVAQAAPGAVASEDEIRRAEAAFAANPNNWNRSRLESARGRFGR